MPHSNAALSYESRRRLVARYRTRQIAHVAAEAAVSRQCLGKWVARWREHADAGLHDRSSRPHTSASATPPAVVDRVLAMRKNKWSAPRIVRELALEDIAIAACAVSRILRRHGLNRLDHLDVDGEPLRAPGRSSARYPGHIVHIDVKGSGRSPTAAGGDFAAAARPRTRPPTAPPAHRAAWVSEPATYACTPPSTTTLGWRSPRPTTTRPLPPRSHSCATRGRSSLRTASRGSLASSPTTNRPTGPATSPAQSARSSPGINGSSPTRPGTTARLSATSTPSPESTSTPAATPARPNAATSSASGSCTTTTTARTAAGHQPPASRRANGVTNVMPNYS